ncbi:MAG TPA: hypothetical protein DCE81_03860 [Cytophagales bacterium]|nr:hypothetical protein [Cytophagales bacterium]
MKNYFTVLFALVTLSSSGQDTKKYYYDNGQLKSEVTIDKSGLLTRYSSWDIYGNLLTTEVFKTQYKDYPKRDFTKVQWTPVINGVSISKFNTVDTSIVVLDSSFVTLNYQCYFENGQMLDNSFAKGCPLMTRLDYMVRGFIEGVKKMKPGETALIRIEPSMAFGDKVAGNVPANSTLIYLVNLISSE